MIPSQSQPQPKPAAGAGPSSELVELFRRLEAKVDEATRLIANLRREKLELQARLEQATRARAETVQRIDALIDKIDGLL
ncbi:MAG TPA: hypothetical protein VMH22_04195 [bacterium]|nr:hypothetical protein [bacterium]